MYLFVKCKINEYCNEKWSYLYCVTAENMLQKESFTWANDSIKALEAANILWPGAGPIDNRESTNKILPPPVAGVIVVFLTNVCTECLSL